MVLCNLFLMVYFLKSDQSNLEISSFPLSCTAGINYVLLDSDADKVSTPLVPYKFDLKEKKIK